MKSPENINNNYNSKESVVDSFLAQKLGNTAISNKNEHVLTPDELAEYAEKFRKEEIENAPIQIEKIAKEIRDLELDFAGQVKRSEEKGEPHISEKEFLFWESDYTDLWHELENQKYKGHLDSYQEAKSEEPMFFTQSEAKLAKTIEAQAGVFYARREDELLDAIRDNGWNQEEIDYVNGFAKSVFKHLDYKYMSATEIRAYGYDEYEKDRTRVYNDAIRHLNGLNHLAEKYRTKRFTPRDFWTSDVPASQQTKYMSKRMRYDRDVVEEYYNHAFRREAERREKEQERALRYGINY